MLPVGLVPPDGSNCSSERAVTDFPEPDFTDQRKRLAAVEGERNTLRHTPRAERNGQVSNFDQAHVSVEK